MADGLIEPSQIPLHEGVEIVETILEGGSGFGINKIVVAVQLLLSVAVTV